MKKKLALLIGIIMILSCVTLAACGNKSGSAEEPKEEPAQNEEQQEEEELTDPVDGAAYGYAGDDPVEAAVYQYLSEQAGEHFDVAEGEVTIPIVRILDTEEADNGDVLVRGDFSIMNYAVEGDTLKMKSGGNFPGVITCIQAGEGYSGQKMEVVEDGGNFEESAKKIFGDKYEDFVKLDGDDKDREKVRAEIIANYVKANDLKVTKYQDEGWDPVELKL